VKLPVELRIYTIADIHGRADLLRTLLRAIQKDADQHRNTAHLLITLGDYIDRGPDSRDVLDLLSHHPLKGFSRQFLKGNHELMLLNFLNDPEQGPLWFQNGGDATLLSYGIDAGFNSPSDKHEEESPWVVLRDKLLKKLPPTHLHFLKSLQPYYQIGDYFFVHGGIRPGVAFNQQSEEDLLWIRQEFLDYSRDFGKIVVHGHSIVKEPQVRRNRIALDTGAFHTGRLTCLVLSREECFFLQATTDVA
jgi:serine/threonine protein phosphatase 1